MTVSLHHTLLPQHPALLAQLQANSSGVLPSHTPQDLFVPYQRTFPQAPFVSFASLHNGTSLLTWQKNFSPPHDSLRSYQRGFVHNVVNQVKEQTSPWLGIASPMQTGKSHATPHIINELKDEFDQVIVLTDSRISFAQCLEKLNSTFGDESIGGFGPNKHKREFLNVATMQSLKNHLDAFDPKKRTLIVLDEAITTQTPTIREILSYFELGESNANQLDKGLFVPPQKTQNVLIGLSGTGGGLEGYDICARLDMITAIKDNWVRHMIADQAYMGPLETNLQEDPQSNEVTYEIKRTPQEGQQIWWKKTKRNARILAEDYFDHIHEQGFRKTMIFVPQIEHGKLMQEALVEIFVERGYGDITQALNFFGFVHSKQSETENDEEVKKWENGGALISVQKLKRSFSATGSDAVYHTYQTESAELFAQRTGRAWGNNTERDLPSLYVREVTWSKKQKFTNLAKLLGLVDYPQTQLNTKELIKQLPGIRRRADAGAELHRNIEEGNTSKIFQKIPLVRAWRKRFRNAVAHHPDGIQGLARDTKIPLVYLNGFAQGGLPTRIAQVEILAPYLDTNEDAIALWVKDWQRVALQIQQGVRALPGKSEPQFTKHQLCTWHNESKDQDIETQAQALDQILATLYGYPLTAAETAILQGALEVYAHHEILKDSDISEYIGFEEAEHIQNGASAVLFFGRIQEKHYKKLMCGLIHYFQAMLSPASDLPADTKGAAAAQLQNLIDLEFERQGWQNNPYPEAIEDELLFLTRWLLIRKHGSQWHRNRTVTPSNRALNQTYAYTTWVQTGIVSEEVARHEVTMGMILSQIHTMVPDLFHKDETNLRLNFLDLICSIEFKINNWSHDTHSKEQQLRDDIRKLMLHVFGLTDLFFATRLRNRQATTAFNKWIDGKVPASEIPFESVDKILDIVIAHHPQYRSLAKKIKELRYRCEMLSLEVMRFLKYNQEFSEAVDSQHPRRNIKRQVTGVWKRTPRYSVSSSSVNKILKQKPVTKKEFIDLVINASRYHTQAERDPNARLYRYAMMHHMRKLDYIILSLGKAMNWKIADIAMECFKDGENCKNRNDMSNFPLLFRIIWGTLINLIPIYGLNWPANLIPPGGTLEACLKGEGLTWEETDDGGFTLTAPTLTKQDQKRLLEFEKRIALDPQIGIPTSANPQVPHQSLQDLLNEMNS